MLVGVNGYLPGEKLCAGQIVAVVCHHLARHADGHCFGTSVVEEKLHVVGCHLGQFRRTKQLGRNLLHDVGMGDDSFSRGLGVGSEFKGQGAEFPSRQISDQCESLVADGDMYGVIDVARDDDILGYSHQSGRHGIFILVGLVESHEQPECSTQKEKEQKNQKLLVHRTEQEVPDKAVYPRQTIHVCATYALWPMATKWLLLLLGSTFENTVFLYGDDHTTGNLHLNGICVEVYALDRTVYTALCHHFRSVL